MGLRREQLVIVLLLLTAFSSTAENSVSRVKRQDCGPQYFRCQNGKCIRNFKVCDGAADCSDKSDESKVTCKSRLCSSALFQCAYGACVDGNAACDGTIQCEGDGSDEAPELCGTSSAPMCTLPLKHKNGGYKVLGCDSQFCGFGPGAQVPSGTQLQFFCDEGYHISGPNDSYCLDEAFSPPPPVCEKSRLFSTSSTLHYAQCPPLVYDLLDIKCYSSFGQKIACNKPMSVGSKANLACKSNYVKTKEFNYTALTCTDSGTWDNQPFTCVPECGKAVPKQRTYVINGEPVSAVAFPWHVGIYIYENGIFDQLCGGTIIKRKLVLTAAHCFTQSTNPKDYMIGAGKYHRGWDIKDPMEQRLEVESIVIKDTYQGSFRDYADDIAIIVLKTEITISDFVRLACVDLERKYDKQLINGNTGSIAHWGYVDRPSPNDEILTSILPVFESVQCNEVLPVTFKYFFTSDKFCAGYANGSAVCLDDDGGGFLLEQEATATTKQWFIQGVYSLGVPPSVGTLCPSYPVLFTKVNDHLNWLKTYYDKY
ncbi:modular serine protease-like [Schistocerca piceifrons]|uniref:modular serine protease-like n=1 Tax=Schistocerca piceifrons TaxID=274613 RepID=UPI001F5E6FC0|nr:modular serine protease-like [Schistocerca piceifrons]